MSAVLILFLIALLARKLTPLYRRRWILWASTSLMTVGSLLYVAYSYMEAPSVAILYLSAGLSGIGLAPLILLWYEVYGSLSFTKVAIYYSASLLFGALISFVLGGLEPAYFMGVMVCLPALSAVSLALSYGDIPEEKRPGSFSVAASFPWKPVILLVVYNFAWGVGLGFTGSPTLYRPLGIILPCLFVLISVLFFREKFSLVLLYGVVWSVMILGLLLVPLLGGGASPLAKICVNASYYGLVILTTLILSDIIFRFGVSAIWIWGFTRAASIVVSLLGETLSKWLQTNAVSQTLQLEIVAVVVAALVILSSRFLFREREYASRWGISLASSFGDQGQISSRERILLRCEEIARRHSLSPREEEVLLLLAQGDSITEIEKELFIAHGTAKAHIGHIYAKVGVHSRAELEVQISQGFPTQLNATAEPEVQPR